jgi:hypothetical protein
LKAAGHALGCDEPPSLVHLEFQAFFHGKLAQPGKLFKNTVTG